MIIGRYIYFHYGLRDDDILVIRVFRPVLQGFVALIHTCNNVVRRALRW
jgi:hypothetical protein